ncbi:adhesion G-protein coupled receptor G2 [Xyrauchen texanus]|uniref:adhesion G-protein coupled receptor G2 n=1 Tax=Xyrauchen texanus TaxID=154827 RepID=UPI0022422AC4|nr:adhesion G-protein coupled receptor G2 [Xyrauchen texanus]
METKPLDRWSFGHWRPMDHVFFLVMILLPFSVMPVSSNGSVTGFPNNTSPTNVFATSTNVSATSTNVSAMSAIVITRHFTTLPPTTIITMTETPTTSSHLSNLTTSMTGLHTTEATTSPNQTVDTTPHPSTNVSSFSNTSMMFTTSTAIKPEPSSPSIQTNSTQLLFSTTMQLTSTVQTPMPCDFHQNCNQTFYFMSMSVEVTGEPQKDQNIRTWLEEVFKKNLDSSCAQYSSVLTMNTSLFETMEVSCNPENITKDAFCTVLLKLSKPVSVCCIRDTMMKAGGNSSINVTKVVEIERVGVCGATNGPYNKCKQSVKLEDVCNSNMQNFTCGNSSSMIIPLETGAQQNCTVSPPPPSGVPCFCSSYCNNSDAYYNINIDVSSKLNLADTESSVYQLLKNSTCNNTSSDCMIIQTFRSRYRDLRVICSQGKGRLNCNIIMKLNTTMDLCDVHTAFRTIITSQFSVNIISITRVAMCSWNNSSEPLRQNVTWVQPLVTNLNSADFCMKSNRDDLVGYCSQGSSVVLPLFDPCNSSVPMATASPPFTSTLSTAAPTFVTPSVNETLSNTTTINATISTTVSLENQTSSSPANVTVIVSTTTSVIDADQLLSMTANASSLNATQVDQILLQLESLLSGPNVSLALGNTSVKIVGNLLDVPVAVITPFSKRAIGIVDTVGFKLVVSGESQSILSPSLALAVKKVDGANFQETAFSITDPSNLQIRGEFTQQKDVVGQVRSTPLGSITLPASLTQNLTTQDQQFASRVQFNYYQKSTFFQDKALDQRKLNSGILSTSVGNVSISGLQNEVVITLKNTEPIPANYVASCVFWDFGLNGGSGGWNSQGCRVINSTSEETQCGCNHLTSFGILLDIFKAPISARQNLILTYITFIGCGISSIFLSITLLTYLAFGKLRKDIPSKILIQLCIALLLLNLVFLLDAWLALYPYAVGLCISTAFFLHYFLLASFTWMALEAVHMYLALVKVFNTYIRRIMIKMGLAGWGIPLIVVIIVIAIDKDNYGLVPYAKFPEGTADDFCWIRKDIVFYVAVVAYFCVVFLLNVIMFIVVMIQLCRIKKQNPHNVQNRSGWQEMRSVTGLTVLLGLTWGFAFFAWEPVNLAFMYLFAIFNTLQGFFIFVFHCAMKENVRRQWRTYLCCGRLRLAENSEWSRTATQKIKKASMKGTSMFRSSHSAQSSNSSSSFLNNDSMIRAMPMGISNPMDDRIITASELPISGMILNEINGNYRNQRSY